MSDSLLSVACLKCVHFHKSVLGQVFSIIKLAINIYFKVTVQTCLHSQYKPLTLIPL